MLAVMTKFRNVCAHSDRLFDFRTKDALCDMKIHERPVSYTHLTLPTN